MNNNIKWQPFIYAVLIALGIFIGIWLRPAGSMRNLMGGQNKFGEVLNLIQQAYVDTVNVEKLEEKTLNDLLTQLDPHSVYIPASDLQQANEQLEGNFEGIGVEFNILNDTIMVVSAINGGPSQELGIQAGDRIVQVDTQRVAGVGIRSEQVFKLLRGKKGTEVKVKIYRPDAAKVIPYTIVRNTIPIHSLDAGIMLDGETGYIKISRFAATTHDEFVESVNQLKLLGMQNLILDLRGNPGGYLTAATEMCDELLDGDKMIVYTSGRTQPRNEYKAERAGLFEKGKLVVLIDEGSASASEILSGAVQDWDRGIIIGRRSFGKGLVQEPFSLRDGSAIRLTVARYYTPSGRCIQKPYEDGYDEYEAEIYHRYEDGELTDTNARKVLDTTVYKTSGGRDVYSKGGIMPDVIVPIDTNYRSLYVTEVLSAGLLNQFVFTYVDGHRKELSKFSNVVEFNKAFKTNLFELFVQYAAAKGISGTAAERNRGSVYLNRHLKALVARQLWRDKGYYTVLSADDEAIKKALKALGRYHEILHP
jgi:carboxyl-terminal processing protease